MTSAPAALTHDLVVKHDGIFNPRGWPAATAINTSRSMFVSFAARVVTKPHDHHPHLHQLVLCNRLPLIDERVHVCVCLYMCVQINPSVALCVFQAGS